mmetsp:Transcript_37380/g.61966  ORF Transcript_37380/g.61966 Transcript_37380/m.61966 type:complete len:269 (+) Transcript_37380:121-927(+)
MAWNFDFTSFEYVPGKTLLSDYPTVFAVIVAYLVVVFGLPRLLKHSPPFQLHLLFQLHNYFLSLVSLVLLVALAQALVPRLLQHGLLWGVCSADVFVDQRLNFYFYINYLLKYYELLDTLFLILKKKKTEFLHVYHHSLTVLLCVIQLNGNTTVQWVPIGLNLLVHTVMYYYYGRTATGAKLWWKKYLTSMQITQFVIDLIAIYSAMYIRHAYDHGLPSPVQGSCHGDLRAGWFGTYLLSSYLYLFIEFFWKTYISRRKGAQLKSKSM